MDELCRLVTAGDVAGAIAAGEQLEFHLALNDLSAPPPTSSSASSNTQTTSSSGTTPEFYTVLQLFHLINGDAAGARSVAKRSQSIVQTSADAATPAALELTAVTSLAERLAARDLPAAHRLMAAHAWSAPVVATLIDALRAAERERTLALLAAAYENISIDRVAAMLGMVDLDEVAAKVLERGWKAEDGGRWLVPPSNAEQVGGAVAQCGAAPGENINSGLSQLASLARMVVHLEFV
ncbi:COP9 signalosome complex subunit 8 [Geranomyces variabilis]|uniref:COP9 signalosome complex subunit 8 n=1 Tax=Geranomyces variabilis TaxID=109894 RepID=A0AAD5TS39_9FUNG|nr:COP9 signalosome complex subunit 8 [Geranomyces variabilis]